MGEYFILTKVGASSLLIETGTYRLDEGVLGAITSIAPTPSGHMASISLDRLFRLHTTFPPPAAPSATGQDQHKGATVCKEFVKSVPTVIVWDGEEEVPIRREDNGDEENMWDGMEEVDDDEGEDESDSRRKSKRGRQE
jgi:ribosome biogenesis protein NSA1